MKSYVSAIATSALLLMSPISQPVEFSDFTYSIGVSNSDIRYDWYGASEATFEYSINTIRLEAEHNSGFAFRVGYGINEDSSAKTTITNQDFKIELSEYAEFEFLYKYKVSRDISTYIGIGHYLHELPIYSFEGDLVHYDRDDDHGYFVGVEYDITDNVSLDTFFKQTSRVGAGRGSCDIECQTNWIAKGSTIRQVGVGLNYKF